MAAYSKCARCKGNMWPTTGNGPIEHPHLADETVLKKKYRVLRNAKNRPALGGANEKRKGGNTLRPRRRAYGPF